MATILRSVLYKELEEKVELRLYGAFLGLVEPLVAYFWIFQLGALGYHRPRIPAFLSIHQPALCSPLWQDCSVVRDVVVSNDIWFAFGLETMAELGLVSSILFALGGRRRVWLAHTLMVLAVAIKCIFLLIDFRLEHNAHKMALWISFAFLFLPNKRDTCRVLLSSFYFWAGVIKVNKEWLSGAALLGKQLWPAFLFPPAVIPIACAYAVVMELVSTWGLLCDGIWLGWALLQFAMFHASSFTVVGFFYPLTMYLLLSLGPLVAIADRARRPKKATHPSMFRRFFLGHAPFVTYLIFGVFAYWNIAPYFYPGDKAVSGEGRLMALHMYDADVSCNNDPIQQRHRTTNLAQPLYSRLRTYRGRSRCDPFVIMQQARYLCGFVDTDQHTVDVKLLAKRSTENDMAVVVSEHDICGRFLFGSETPAVKNASDTLFRYRWWTHNDWIYPNEEYSKRYATASTENEL